MATGIYVRRQQEHEGDFTASARTIIILYNKFENYTFKTIAASPRLCLFQYIYIWLINFTELYSHALIEGDCLGWTHTRNAIEA